MEPKGPNRVAHSRVVRGEEAYLYAFKSRAKRHHCLGYGTASIDVGRMLQLHHDYCHRVRTITCTPPTPSMSTIEYLP